MNLYKDYWEVHESLFWESLDPELAREICGW